MTPIIAFERLFFAVFGQTSPDDINSQRNSRPEWTENLFKLVYGIYMLVSVIVLINLLIAMMSDTYQRIQVIMPHFSFSLHFWCMQLNWSSSNEPDHVVWTALFRCVWSNHHRANAGGQERRHAHQNAATLDRVLVQNSFWYLYVGVSSCLDQSADCHDVRHVSAYSGIRISELEDFPSSLNEIF